jgi:hypothetical protein
MSKPNEKWEQVQGIAVAIVGGILLAAVIALPLMLKCELTIAAIGFLNK